MSNAHNIKNFTSDITEITEMAENESVYIYRDEDSDAVTYEFMDRSSLIVAGGQVYAYGGK